MKIERKKERGEGVSERKKKKILKEKN